MRFGTFNTLELGKVTINEYGSNFMKYKQDPLVTIETKRALFENKKSDSFQLEDFGSEKKLPTILEDMGPTMVGRAISMSPVKGSQGGPKGDQSSQEEAQQKVQEGQEQLAEVTEAVEKEVGVDDNTQD